MVEGAVVLLVVLALPQGAPLPIFGQGDQTRTLTHVQDIADGIVTATGHEAALNEDFNISAGDERTIADVCQVIWEQCGRTDELVFEHLPTFDVDVQRRWPDVSKAKALLDWESRIPLDKGIADTVAWLRTV